MGSAAWQRQARFATGAMLLAGALAHAQQVGNGGATVQPPSAPASPSNASPELRIEFADVEGGQATLFIAPTGESLLVDTGWPGNNARDADRIVALAHGAGLKRIDTVLLTHYHEDHTGGFPALADRIPIGRVFDHGPNRELTDAATSGVFAAYQKALAAHPEIYHHIMKPADHFELGAVAIEVLSADGQVLGHAADGVEPAPNPACGASPLKPVENSENDRSLGIFLRFGHLRVLDLGDLTWAKERDLVCPANRLGTVDVYIVSHHGASRSGSPAFLAAIRPRVAVMDNGAHKGNEPGAWEIIEQPGTSPAASSRTDLWQLHSGEEPGAHNVAESRIANLPGPDHAASLELQGGSDGAISVRNSRTGELVRYDARENTHQSQ